MKTARTTVLVLILGLALSSCGKKGDLEPPERKSNLEASAEIQPRG